MRHTVLGFALAATLSTAASAQGADAPAASTAAASAPIARAGQTLRDGANSRIGVIDRVNADGSVKVIVGTRLVTIPAEKMVSSNGVVTTSLSKREVSKLN
jgi:hypothetical protein